MYHNIHYRLLSLPNMPYCPSPPPPPDSVNTATIINTHQYLHKVVSHELKMIKKNGRTTYFWKNVFSTSSGGAVPSGLTTIGLFNSGSAPALGYTSSTPIGSWDSSLLSFLESET